MVVWFLVHGSLVQTPCQLFFPGANYLCKMSKKGPESRDKVSGKVRFLRSLVTSRQKDARIFLKCVREKNTILKCNLEKCLNFKYPC